METQQQSIPLKTPDQMEVEVPSRYSDICGIVGDLYIRATLQTKHTERKFADRIRNLESQVQALVLENETLKRIKNESGKLDLSDN